MSSTFHYLTLFLISLLLLIQHHVAATSGKFIHLSDIHLNLLYNTKEEPHGCKKINQSKHPLGVYGCDSSPDLVSSTILQMSLVDPNPDFILVTGDLIFHDVPTVTVMNETFSTLVGLFQKFFPNTLVVPVVGNHDVFDHDVVGPSDPGLGLMHSFWNQSFRQIGMLNAAVTSTFLLGGYYYVPLPNNIFLIQLNTVYYIPQDTDIPDGDPDPAGQFQFLRTTLDMVTARGGRAIISQHVPQGASRSGSQLFNSIYEDSMQSIIVYYSDVILAVLAGHIHRDLYRIYYQADGQTPAVPVLINGAVTPVDNSNPSFTYFSYNATNILDYDKYYVDLSHKKSTWTLEYTFSQSYPNFSGAITAEYLDYMASELSHNSVLKIYENNSAAEYSKGIITDQCFYICSTQETMFDDYKGCAKDKDCKLKLK